MSWASGSAFLTVYYHFRALHLDTFIAALPTSKLLEDETQGNMIVLVRVSKSLYKQVCLSLLRTQYMALLMHENNLATTFLYGSANQALHSSPDHTVVVIHWVESLDELWHPQERALCLLSHRRSASNKQLDRLYSQSSTCMEATDRFCWAQGSYNHAQHLTICCSLWDHPSNPTTQQHFLLSIPPK